MTTLRIGTRGSALALAQTEAVAKSLGGDTELGPWYDVCRPGCCENARLGFKPALAGVAP